MIRKIKSGVILELWLQKIPIKIKSGRCVLMCIYLVRTPSHIYIAYILYLNFFDMISKVQNGNIL